MVNNYLTNQKVLTNYSHSIDCSLAIILLQKWFIVVTWDDVEKASIAIGVCLIFIGSISWGYILGSGPLWIWETVYYSVDFPVFEEDFSVQPNAYEIKSNRFGAGTEIIVNFKVASDEIVYFFIFNEENFMKWQNNEKNIKHLFAYRTNLVDSNFTTPHNGDWYFVWDNTFTNTETKEIEVKITYIETGLPFHGKIINRWPEYLSSIAV